MTVINWAKGLQADEQKIVQNCLIKMLDLIEDESCKAAVFACQAGVDVAALVGAWMTPNMGAAKCVARDKTLSTVIDLKRRQARWEQPYNHFVNSIEPATDMTLAVATVQAWMMKAQMRIDEVIGYHKSSAIGECKKAMEKLEPIAGGLLEGGCWKDGFNGNFDELVKLAESTCIANGPMDLMAGTKAMQEVPQPYI
eukprot:2267834-Amphidinium_carterae.4